MKPDRIVELRERARILIEYQPISHVPITGKELNECLDEIERLQEENETLKNGPGKYVINEIDRISEKWEEIQNGM